MKKIFVLFFLVLFSISFSQETKPSDGKGTGLRKTREQREKEKAQKAPIDKYKIISHAKDTTIVDTSLTLKSLYKYNYLRKDLFGKMVFPNEGQPYTKLNFATTRFSAFPSFGHTSKHDAYMDVEDINYYSVPTPLSEIYFKTVMEQGQNVDAFLTMNTSDRFNISMGYKGLRSLGRYINQLSSTGNFRLTSSYATKNKRYILNTHYTGQDFQNNENGGIVTLSEFEGNNAAYKNRARVQVFLTDAKSYMRGRRYYIDHSFRINPKDAQNNLMLSHQFNYEYKFYEYSQSTITTTIGSQSINHFGALLNSDASVVKDQNRFTKLYNKATLIYENKTLGRIGFFAENFNNQFYYKNQENITLTNGTIIPASIKNSVTTIGGQYEYRKEKWNGKVSISNAITKQTTREFDAFLNYKINDKNVIKFHYQNISKLPNNTATMYMSGYQNYNWNNNFKNEKINNLTVDFETKWVNLAAQVSNLSDYIYFKDNSTNYYVQLVSPQQYDKSIQYINVKASKELKYRKWSLDNTILYQKTSENEALYVPDFTTRSTLAYSNYYFKKALYMQAGVSCNYFSKYYANGYNPVLSESFTQNQIKIGNAPIVDLFVNAKVKTARIYLIAENLSAKFSKPNYYSAPGIPYHDFMIRFGLVWTFFQ